MVVSYQSEYGVGVAGLGFILVTPSACYLWATVADAIPLSKLH
jgi:hypothetical protein